MLCIATHLRHFFLTFLCPSARYPRYATAGCERKDKKFHVIKFCPLNFFDSFAPLSYDTWIRFHHRVRPKNLLSKEGKKVRNIFAPPPTKTTEFDF